MGNLTKNISRSEVACQCGCGFDTIDHEVIAIVQETTDHFAKERGIERSVVIINSGARCDRHNKKVGGKLESQHIKCRAIDFTIKEISPAKTVDYLEKRYPDKYGIGWYRTFVHIDTKSGRARRWSFK